MAAISYEAILSSDIFRIIVGPDKREFSVHSAVLAAQSPSLAKLVSGPFREARERRADWQDVEVDTFLRFMEFVYTGNYSGAPTQEREVTADGTNDINAQPVPVYPRTPSPALSIPYTPAKYASLWTEFTNLHPDPAAHSSTGTTMPNHDHADTFLSHAKLYVFADYYGIVSLTSLSLHKLQRALQDFELDVQGVEDVVQLVRYSYDHTRESGQTVDTLRNLVNIYTACKLEDLWKGQSYQSLVETNGQYSRGLVGEMQKRLMPVKPVFFRRSSSPLRV